MTDLILRGGQVYDGLGGHAYTADVGITGSRITAIGDLSGDTAGRVIDVSGLAVSPGFIDIHTHSDFAILDNPFMESSLTQGVTTEVVGNCGMSMGLVTPDPVFSMEARWTERGGHRVTWRTMHEYLGLLDEMGIGHNICTLAGHGTIRKAVLGFENRPPDASELSKMQSIVHEAMDAGAVGLSTGLEYVPGSFAGFDEQLALVKVAADAGGFFATHLRNEGDTLVESVQEAIDIAEAAGAPLQLSHHKAEGAANWSKIDVTLGMMESARERGLDVLTDQYPYTAFMTGLSVIILPAWAMEGTSEDTAKRLSDPIARARILDEIAVRNLDWPNIRVGIARNRPEAQGMSLVALGEHAGTTPAEAALDLILAEDGWVSAVHFAMSESNVEQILRYPYTMIGSDGIAHDADGPQSNDNTHPRSYGTFSRLIGRYVREKGILSLGEAVRRMTSLPAQRLRFRDRGTLRVGAIADITVFNAAVISDRATFESPHQHSAGIGHVIVNGRVAVESGVPQGGRFGQVLRRA
jgi:N-acyl-D-amino-acid deacylase